LTKLSPHEKDDYLWQLADSFDTLFACLACFRLRPIDAREVPHAGEPLCGHRGYCKAAWTTRHLGAMGYNLWPHHIQAALKFTRRNGIQPEYLESLMRPYSAEESRDDGILKPRYHVHPGIVGGSFLLYSMHIWQSRLEDVPISTGSMKFFYICPHLSVDPMWTTDRRPLYQMIQSALQTPFLCNRCSVIDLSNHWKGHILHHLTFTKPCDNVISTLVNSSHTTNLSTTFLEVTCKLVCIAERR
jgi:hypothetical protein